MNGINVYATLFVKKICGKPVINIKGYQVELKLRKKLKFTRLTVQNRVICSQSVHFLFIILNIISNYKL